MTKTKKVSTETKIHKTINILTTLIGSVGISLMAGLIGSFFTFSEINSWYATLNKPVFNPPNWIFGPVWTVLYILMGISLFLIIETKNKKVINYKKVGYIVFGAQLALNTLWSLIFFGMKDLGLALFVILVLWTCIAFSIYYFNKVNKVAAALLVPYILWVSFATVLNFSILMLN